MLLQFSYIVSIFADAQLRVTLLTFIDDVTDQVMGMSWYFAIAAVPALLFSFLIGAFVERRVYQKVMLSSDLGRAALMGLLIVYIVLTPDVSPGIIYVFIFLDATISLFFAPADSALLPHIVDMEHIATAQSINQIAFAVVRMISYGIVAVNAYLGVSAAGSIGICLIMYAISALTIACVRPYRKAEVSELPQEKPSLWRDVADGLRYTASHVTIRGVMIVVALTMIVVSSIDIYVIASLTKRFGFEMSDMYLITPPSFLGMIVGSLIAPRIIKRWAPNTLFTAMLAMCILLIGILVIDSLMVMLFSLFILCIMMILFNICMVTTLQHEAAPGQRARLFSLVGLINTCTLIPGNLLFGILIDRFGFQITPLILAGYLCIVTLLSLKLLPKTVYPSTVATEEDTLSSSSD
jgi:MFS family permease